MDRRDYMIIAGLLLPFFIALPWGLWKNSQLKDTREAFAELRDSLSRVSISRVALVDEKETLRDAYKTMITDNESLRDSLEKAEATVITRYVPNPDTATANADLEAQLKGLQVENIEIKDTVRVLRIENKEIKEEVVTLKKEVTEVKQENVRLTKQVVRLNRRNGKLQQQMDRLMVQGFRATDFQISLYRDENQDKLTSKAGKVRSLEVAFSLNKISEQFHGNKAFYLVLTDPTGAPVTGQSPIKVTTSVRGQEMQLPALARIDRTVGENQRFKIEVPVTDRLRAGTYQARIIADVGMLGAAGFTVE